jgi:hypothetical protein
MLTPTLTLLCEDEGRKIFDLMQQVALETGVNVVRIVGYHHIGVCDCLGLVKDMMMERRGEKYKSSVGSITSKRTVAQEKPHELHSWKIHIPPKR